MMLKWAIDIFDNFLNIVVFCDELLKWLIPVRLHNLTFRHASMEHLLQITEKAVPLHSS